MNLKNLTYKKVKEGILNMTPVQQLYSKLVGTLGGIVGLILAFVTLIYQRLWGFSIFIFFFIFIQFITFIGMRQQYIELKKMYEDLKGGKENGT